MIAAILFGLAIGAVVGMVGGGGAVLAVPVLVYAVGLDVHEATTVSLAVVAAATATGAVTQMRSGTVCWSSAAWFASAAVAGSVVGTALNAVVGGAALLMVFSVVMLLAARATWERAGQERSDVGCPRAQAKVLLPVGFVVGALTGLIGVGGGFVIVPALAIGLSFGMRQAMGTSMVIVLIVSLAGLGSHLVAGNPFDAEVALAMGGAAAAGAFLGARLAPKVPVRQLGRGFAVLVALVAVGVASATLAGVGV
ncbi:MAG: sulfite exporter TauE/SafE family protein [Solirubrobacteraceae bacterium]|nr:sulfite exporter TauE/SafE family protein [Solirubrobacteraceae bacterium]